MTSRAQREETAFEEIMNNFNFARVHKIMEELGWTWWYTNGVPSVDEMRTSVRDLFSRFVSKKDIRSLESGGFRLSRHEGDEVLALEFIVEECFGGYGE